MTNPLAYFDDISIYSVIALFMAIASPIVFIKFFVPIIRSYISKKNKSLFKNLVSTKFFYTFGFILPPILILILFSGVHLKYVKQIPEEIVLLKKLASFSIIIIFPLLVNKIITAINQTFKKNEFFIRYPINSYLQLLKLVVLVISAILAFCYLLNLSPWGILSGIGALGAIILLVFKDTILGLVASIQVYSGGLVKEGDWIEMRSLDIDGEVLEVGLHRVKVKAWDNSITTFPTSKFLELTFKNWRNMTESGGRRIKRTLIIKSSSVKFLNKSSLNEISKLSLMKNYITNKSKELSKENNDKINTPNERRLTNIGCFRAYVYNYLTDHKNINQNMTILVRQLPINQYGLPLEIYAFTKNTEWKNYEDTQSDIFDHLLASIKYFELELYQYPSSNDLRK